VTSGGTSYTPPSASQIKQAQNTPEALRLLLAQRRLYDRAKRWSYLRWVGFSLIGVIAPVMTVFAPKVAVGVGAIAGIWIFLSRTVFNSNEQSLAAKGAGVQEDFDLLVFDMPELGTRVPAATLEEVADLAGPDATVQQRAGAEKLKDWYPVDTRLNGLDAIAIAQRANAAYSERLLNSNANVWLAVTVVWAIASIAVSIGVDLSLETFLLGVALPLLPALLDVWEQWRHTRRAGATRRAMAYDIEKYIRGQGEHPMSPADLSVWQDQLYELRRRAPQVPNLVYRRARSRNERAMHAAAGDLTRAAILRTGGTP
jgi:uncharacterized membrane protein